MPRQASVSVENNFSKGLITEATGLNFPENAATETYNCVFDKTGEVVRRLGIDVEASFADQGFDDTDVAVTEFVWTSVALTGELTFLVVQAGDEINFYTVDEDGELSPNQTAFTINLNDFKTSGSPVIKDVHASFAAGNGQLFIAHPYCESIFVEYDVDEDDITTTAVDIKIRDIEGVPNYKTGTTEVMDADHRPSNAEFNQNQFYNLINRGWGDARYVTWNRKFFGTTTTLALWRTPIVAFVPNALALFNAGLIYVPAIQGIPEPRTDWPSDADQVQLLKQPMIPALDDTGNVVAPIPPAEAVSLLAVDENKPGNSPAPRGQFLYPAFHIDRQPKVDFYAATSFVSTGYISPYLYSALEIETSGYARPSAIQFFAGRVWYAGVDAPKYNTRIYFSQIVESNRHYNECYQQQDPSAADAPSNDLLPSDGGIIVIPEISRVIKLFPLGSSLLVFATNGVWKITGSAEGAGFSAINYTVTRISDFGALSAQSFVSVDGTPFWWNTEGIYTIQTNGVSAPQATSITNTTIQDFFDDIPATAKRYAKGAFNKSTKTVQWVYTSEAPTTVTSRYTYDRVLNLDTTTGAFFPWTVATDPAYICGIVSIHGFSTNTTQEVVTDDGVDVQDAAVDVTSGMVSTLDIESRFKYLVLAAAIEAPPAVSATTMTASDATLYNGKIYFSTGSFSSGASADANAQIIDTNLTSGGYPWYTDTYNFFTDRITGTEFWGLQALQYGTNIYILEWDSSGAVGGGSEVGLPSVKVHKYNTVDGAKTSYDIYATETVAGDDVERLYTSGYIADGYLYLSFSDLNTLSDATVGFDGEIRKYRLSDMAQVASISSDGLSTGAGDAGLTNIKIGGSDATYIWGTAFGAPAGRYVIWRCTLSLGSWQICKTTLPYTPFKDGVVSGKMFLQEESVLGSVRNVIARLDTASFSSGGATDTGLTTYDVANAITGVRLRSYNPNVITGIVDSTYLWVLAFSATSNNMKLVRFDKTNFSTNTVYDISIPISGVDDAVIDSHSPIDYSNLTGAGLVQDTTNLYAFIAVPHKTAIMKIPKATAGSPVIYDNSNYWDSFATDDFPGVETQSFGFADARDDEYVDWASVTDGSVDFTSYFITGYKLRGEAIRKFQSNYLQVYTRNDIPSVFDLEGRWDYAIAGTGGRWGSIQRLAQTVTMNDTTYQYATRRLKIRGHGKALQYKVTSVAGEPFNLIGWSMFETANAKP